MQYRLESEDERGNQALYFLASGGSFQPRGSGEFNVSGTIAERLNGILNGVFSNGDGKLNIGLNYEVGQNRPDYQTDDRFGVTLQTQISDRVLINGKDEGTLTANVFNRENSIRSFGEAIGYTQGIGLSYNVDFDTFKELIQNFFKKAEKQKEEELQDQNAGEDQNVLPSFVNLKTSSEE